jgi:hypothetical protein
MEAKNTVILAAGRRLIMRLAAWLEDPRDADGQSWLLTGHWALVIGLARLGRGEESEKEACMT